MKTVATQLTGVGRSAIAVIEVVGIDAAKVIDDHFQQATPSPMQPGQIRYGSWRSGESIVITPITDNHFEIHCHGGSAAIDVILADLNVAQFSELSAEPETQTDSESRATVTKTLLIREAEAVLIHCTTARTAAIAMDQVRGSLQDWANESLTLLTRNAGEGSSCAAIGHQAAQILTYAPFTTHLTTPFRVVLLGAPNVGKSSLTNAILGYDRSITMPTAGTTRDILHAETVIDGILIRLSDTAGIRDTDDAIEQEGTRRAMQELAAADLIIRVRDPDTDFINAPQHLPSINVLNKSDLIRAELLDPTPSLLLSATTGQGIPDLLTLIARRFTAQCPPPGTPAAINDRQATLLRAISSGNQVNDLLNSLHQLLDSPTPNHPR